MIRLHVPDDLRAGAAVAPSPDQARYLLSVMRQKIGDAVLLFNGRDGEWRATVTEVSKRGCLLVAAARIREQATPPDLDLIVALVKRAPLETIVEKATELGVRRIRLMVTRRTNAGNTNLARLAVLAVEAAEQTGRLDVPQILPPQKLDALLDPWPEGRRLMFCDEAGGDPQTEWGDAASRAAPALTVLKDDGRGGPAPWAVMVGPEGGFAPEERDKLHALPFVTPVTLGPRILRADTATIAALALWQATLGDWR